MTNRDESQSDQQALDRDSYPEALPRKVIAAGALIRDTGNSSFPAGRSTQVSHRRRAVDGGYVKSWGSIWRSDAFCASTGLACPRGLRTSWRTYDGGILPGDSSARIELPAGELRSFAFVDHDDLEAYLSPRNAWRCREALRALETGTVVELDRS